MHEIRPDIVYCRFPLVDGSENAAAVLRTAIDSTATLIRLGTPTLVCCSGGMSRTPAIAAAAIAVLENDCPERCLERLSQSSGAGFDVSAGLWREVRSVVTADSKT